MSGYCIFVGNSWGDKTGNSLRADVLVFLLAFSLLRLLVCFLYTAIISCSFIHSLSATDVKMFSFYYVTVIAIHYQLAIDSPHGASESWNTGCTLPPVAGD